MSLLAREELITVCPEPRILVAEPHAGLRQEITRLLRLVGASVRAVDADQLVQTVRTWAPTVVILESRYGTQNALPVMRSVLAADPALRLIVYTSTDAGTLRSALVQRGAYEILVKGSAGRDLVEVVYQAHHAYAGHATPEPAVLKHTPSDREPRFRSDQAPFPHCRPMPLAAGVNP